MKDFEKEEGRDGMREGEYTHARACIHTHMLTHTHRHTHTGGERESETERSYGSLRVHYQGKREGSAVAGYLLLFQRTLV